MKFVQKVAYLGTLVSQHAFSRDIRNVWSLILHDSVENLAGVLEVEVFHVVSDVEGAIYPGDRRLSRGLRELPGRPGHHRD
mgnify:CR=1 FL=1